jgi:hypothetical protein
MVGKFFDINCMTGKWPYSCLHYNTASELFEVMQQSGIYRAAAARIEAYRYHPYEENSKLSEELKSFPAILPCYVLVPHISGESGYLDTEEVIADAVGKNVCFIRLYPTADGFSLQDWCCGELLSSMEKNNMTLLLHFREFLKENSIIEAGERIYDLCSGHPGLSVVILSFRHNNNRIIYKLMETCPNLYFEISFFGVFRQLEDIVSRFGSKRLVFGTNMPFFEPGRSICLLDYADIDKTDKESIAYGNAEKLLSVFAVSRELK